MQMEKKAKEFKIRTASVNPTTVLEFYGTVNKDLAEGWDILSAQSIGLDTGGGQGGGGNVMMVVSLVKYEYFQLAPAAAA
jgi:hypothetical protein